MSWSYSPLPDRKQMIAHAQPYLMSASPSVISIFVPQGSFMNAIAMPSCGTLV